MTYVSGIDFKNGDGPDEAHELLRRLAGLIPMGESGQLPTDTFVEELTGMADEVVEMSVNLSTPRIQEET